MSDRLGPVAFEELEAGLADVATALAFPPTPDIAGAVGARLRASTGGRPARPRNLPLRRSLLLAAALALTVVGAALAVRYGLELLSIEFGPIPSAVPSPAPSPGAATGDQTPPPVGADLLLGRRVTLREADAAAPFDVLVPGVLGAPDSVYLGSPSLRGQVAFVYRPREGLPASDLLRGAALLITQNRGEPDDGLARKLVDTGSATVEPVVVGEASGIWISGEPHFFWYLAPDGAHIQESGRLVGNTLAWERDGILYRIEGEITLERALEIAASMG